MRPLTAAVISRRRGRIHGIGRRRSGQATLFAAAMVALSSSTVPAEPDAGTDAPPATSLPDLVGQAADLGPLAGAAELDAAAAAWIAVRPTDLGDGFALVDLLAGIFPDVVGAFDRVRDNLGLYSFGRSELIERGLDPDALVLLSWGQIDASSWTARHKASHSRNAPSVWARHRAVVKVGTNGAAKSVDETKVENTIVSALQKLAATVVHLPHTRGSPALPAWAKGLARPAARGSVRLMGRTRAGDFVTLRIRGGLAIVDWAQPWAGGRSTTEDLQPVLAKMIAPVRKPLAEQLSRAPRALLASPESSIAVVLSPPGLAALAPHASCREEWSGGDDAFLDEAAVLLRMHPFDWKLEIIWTLTPAGRAAFEGTASDDGLVDGRAIVNTGLVAAALLTSSLDRTVAAPGAKPFARQRLARALADLDGAEPGCGGAAAAVALTRFWPQMIRGELEEALPLLSAAPPNGRPRNLAVLLAEPNGPRNAGLKRSLSFFVSFPDTASPALERVLDAAGSKGERQTFGDRTPRFFDLGAGGPFEEAGLEPLAGGHLGLALAPRGVGLGWYYRMRRRPARFGAQNHVGFLQVNLARLLAKLADHADAGTQAAVKLAASQFGLLGGNLTVEDGTLHLDLALSPP